MNLSEYTLVQSNRYRTQLNFRRMGSDIFKQEIIIEISWAILLVQQIVVLSIHTD